MQDIECSEVPLCNSVGTLPAPANGQPRFTAGGMEFSTFQLKPGTDASRLASAAREMAAALYEDEPGFLAHAVVCNDAGLYADVVLADTQERARFLCDKWGQGPYHPACVDYLALIDPSSVQLAFWRTVA